MDELAFHIYLLGHDSAAKHEIRFERIGKSKKFNITWAGKIAQAYIGDYEYKHDFYLFVTGVTFPELNKNAENSDIVMPNEEQFKNASH